MTRLESFCGREIEFKISSGNEAINLFFFFLFMTMNFKPQEMEFISTRFVSCGKRKSLLGALVNILSFTDMKNLWLTLKEFIFALPYFSLEFKYCAKGKKAKHLGISMMMRVDNIKLILKLLLK